MEAGHLSAGMAVDTAFLKQAREKVAAFMESGDVGEPFRHLHIRRQAAKAARASAEELAALVMETDPYWRLENDGCIHTAPEYRRPQIDLGDSTTRAFHDGLQWEKCENGEYRLPLEKYLDALQKYFGSKIEDIYEKSFEEEIMKDAQDNEKTQAEFEVENKHVTLADGFKKEVEKITAADWLDDKDPIKEVATQYLLPALSLGEKANENGCHIHTLSHEDGITLYNCRFVDGSKAGLYVNHNRTSPFVACHVDRTFPDRDDATYELNAPQKGAVQEFIDYLRDLDANHIVSSDRFEEISSQELADRIEMWKAYGCPLDMEQALVKELVAPETVATEWNYPEISDKFKKMFAAVYPIHADAIEQVCDVFRKYDKDDLELSETFQLADLRSNVDDCVESVLNENRKYLYSSNLSPSLHINPFNNFGNDEILDVMADFHERLQTMQIIKEPVQLEESARGDTLSPVQARLRLDDVLDGKEYAQEALRDFGAIADEIEQWNAVVSLVRLEKDEETQRNLTDCLASRAPRLWDALGPKDGEDPSTRLCEVSHEMERRPLIPVFAGDGIEVFVRVGGVNQPGKGSEIVVKGASEGLKTIPVATSKACELAAECLGHDREDTRRFADTVNAVLTPGSGFPTDEAKVLRTQQVVLNELGKKNTRVERALGDAERRADLLSKPLEEIVVQQAMKTTKETESQPVRVANNVENNINSEQQRGEKPKGMGRY